MSLWQHFKHRLIQIDCIRLLRKCRRNGIDLFEPNDTCVLLTAPAGTAAINIHGLTIHSALLLGGHFSSKLSADNLNTLRNCLAKLTVLVIDEISMVGAELLLEVDQRLRQIKSSDKPFGGISLLAVGDLYQLPPVKQRAVFAISRNLRHALYGSPWLDCVRMVELTRNMRQKDRQFSNMLNRIRVGNCTREDESVLRT
jgi:ATP-dependent exoDNAse (exonuclease V) alpha subunit